MDYGLVLPSLGDDANLEGMVAAVELAETPRLHRRLGDRPPPRRPLARGGLRPDLRGRDDPRLGGRALPRDSPRGQRDRRPDAQRRRAREGAGDDRRAVRRPPDRRASASAGARTSSRTSALADRFRDRGAYTEETIDLCRHLWSGSTEPFHGRFHSSTTSSSGRCPPRAATFRSGSAAATSARCAASAGSPTPITPRRRARPRWPPAIPIIRAAAESAGRPMPRLSGRARVEFGAAARVLLHDARLAGRLSQPRFARSPRSAWTTSRWRSHRATPTGSRGPSSASSPRSFRSSERAPRAVRRAAAEGPSGAGSGPFAAGRPGRSRGAARAAAGRPRWRARASSRSSPARCRTGRRASPRRRGPRRGSSGAGWRSAADGRFRRATASAAATSSSVASCGKADEQRPAPCLRIERDRRPLPTTAIRRGAPRAPPTGPTGASIPRSRSRKCRL